MSLNVFNIGRQCNLPFLSTTVLQGSVATRMNYGKIFNDLFIANLLLSVMVKEFWRSVRIRQSYGKKSSGTFFFRTRCSTAVLYLLPHCLWTTVYCTNNLMFSHSTKLTALFVHSAIIAVIFVVWSNFLVCESLSFTDFIVCN